MNAIKAYFGDFRLLGRLPKEFWGIQTLNFFYCMMYFTFTVIATLHLSQDVGFSDPEAGSVFALFLAGTAIMQVLIGPVMDRLGFRRAPLIAVAIIATSMTAIGLTPLWLGATPVARVMMIIFYLTAMVGNGLMFPVLTAGVKRFTNSQTRTAGFNLWYLTMNGGALFTFLIDFMRRPFNKDNAEVFRNDGGNSLIMFYLAGLVLLCGAIVYSLLKKENQFPEFTNESLAETAGPSVATAHKQETKQCSTWQIISGAFHDNAFRKMLAMLFITIPAHIPFVLMFVLYPKYYTRVIAADVNLGTLNALNPAIIIVGLVAFAPVIKRFNVYYVLLFGQIVSAMSLFVLAIPPQFVQSLIGTQFAISQVYLVMVAFQIIVFAVGEFVWSPQLQVYCASIAPQGSEGTYMGMSRYPYTTAKMIGGAIGGFMLAKFCPEGVKTSIDAGTLGYWQSPEAMNLLMAFFCLLTPVALIFCKRWFFVEAKATDK